MTGRNLAFTLLLVLFAQMLCAADLDHSVSGADDNEDSLSNSTVIGGSPFMTDGQSEELVESSKAGVDDFVFRSREDVPQINNNRKEYEDIGYTLPGTFENQENYIETDRLKMANGFRKLSTGGINISFIKNGYDYDSNNDIINRTIGSGPKSMKGGSLFFRHDNFLLITDFLNFHWAVGAGVGYNSGKGFFSTGARSDTTINLWEIPIDLGLGLEIPVSSWVKFAGTGGPSIMGLLQNRTDFGRGEKGKRKIQYSAGYFVNAQFKVNLSGFSEDAAYELFTSSEITNLYMNLEARLQSYENFADPIGVTGTSFGLGFTFEYL